MTDGDRSCITCTHNNEEWDSDSCDGCCENHSNYDRAIQALEQEPCEDAISREAVLENAFRIYTHECGLVDVVGVATIENLPSVKPQELKKCKDCKWWKDSDGFYRRGGHAESQCPINRREVFEGNGYCYMFELQESEEI